MPARARPSATSWRGVSSSAASSTSKGAPLRICACSLPVEPSATTARCPVSRAKAAAIRWMGAQVGGGGHLDLARARAASGEQGGEEEGGRRIMATVEQVVAIEYRKAAGGRLGRTARRLSALPPGFCASLR